jgi:hypothetical protein
MTCHDVFNGDADGLCALHQLRLVEPRDAVLVTGPKRDVGLLARVDAGGGDLVTVLDISLDVNRAALDALLARGVSVTWFDHHHAGAVPDHPRLSATIDCAPDVCTSMLVDRHLHGRYRAWAALARQDREVLRGVGEALAYAGCGEREADLVVLPAALYRIVHRYMDPLRFAADEPVLRRLLDGARADLDRARSVVPAWTGMRAVAYELPDAQWSRRVASLFANERARLAPTRAHAVLTPNARGGYAVSVRAPQDAPRGADGLCRRFPEGGGRAAAAGINHLPAARRAEFLDALDAAFG